jgi:hypothetical protein
MKNVGKNRTATVQRDAGKAKDLELELESTGSQTMRGVRLPRQFGSGYNPYDTVPDTQGSTGQHRTEDLRRLSEWIRMKRDLPRGNED